MIKILLIISTIFTGCLLYWAVSSDLKKDYYDKQFYKCADSAKYYNERAKWYTIYFKFDSSQMMIERSDKWIDSAHYYNKLWKAQ